MAQQLPWDIPKPKADSYKEHPRQASATPYHTYRWARLSRAFRAEHPLCAECNRNGFVKAATCVDHITPWPICGEQGFFDRANLQALCEDCNNRKGQRDKKRIQEWKRTHVVDEAGGRSKSLAEARQNPISPTRTRKK